MRRGYYFRVINVHETVNGLLVGIFMIVAGLYPGLLQALAEHVGEFADRRTFRFASQIHSTVQFHHQRWIVALGTIVIAATLLAYFVK